ncbi:unnamed protein product, partial [marine sediment metagenome]
MTNKVLVLGGSGMLGSKAFEVLQGRFDTYATFRNNSNVPEPSFHVDVMDFDRVKEVLEWVKPDVVVNCIGVLKDETNPITSITVNALFPHQLAKYCKKLIHISTDCVFSGDWGWYDEEHWPDPD